MQNFRTRESSRASVAILCPYIFFAQAFKGILEHYPDAEIVPDYTATPVGQKYIQKEKDAFRTWLEEQGLPWRDIELTDLTPNEFFAKYTTVVSPFYGGWVAHPALSNHRKVNVFYGVAKDLWGFSLSNAHYDLICTPGPYFTDTLNSLYGKYGLRTISTGEPKLDALASKTRGDARAELAIRTVKPVVVVTSTWGELSSLSKIAPALISITNKYEVILKAHHMTTTYDPDALNVFEGTQVRIIDQHTPISTAVRAADVVISDGSSAIFDSLLANTPTIIIDTIGQNPSFFVETSFYGKNDSKYVGVATRKESLEQIIKTPDHQIGVVVQAVGRNVNRDELTSAIEDSLTKTDRFAIGRKNLIDRYFIPVDGKAALRVAQAIATVAHSEGPHEKSLEAKFFLELIDDLKRRCNHAAQSLYQDQLKGELENTNKIERLKTLPRLARMAAIIEEFFN